MINRYKLIKYNKKTKQYTLQDQYINIQRNHNIQELINILNTQQKTIWKQSIIINQYHIKEKKQEKKEKIEKFK